MSHLNKINSSKLLAEEKSLILTRFDLNDALKLGDMAKKIGHSRNLPIALEIRIGNWIIYHASLPGSTIENQNWIDRKARVVLLTHHSTLFERLNSEETGTDWYVSNDLTPETHSIHGGGLPIITENSGFQGALIISGLFHLEDHLFGVEILKIFLEQEKEKV
jgi:uncharacterized protein (UPF0303 family)